MCGLGAHALDKQQRDLCLDFIELYMACTLRLSDDYHSDASLDRCTVLYAKWLKDVEHFLSSRLGRTPDTERWATPKMHDLQHIIFKIKERGTCSYHSCNA